MILRDYQSRGIFDIRAAFRQGYRRVLYALPTGGGKTLIFTYISEHAAARGTRVCILVHRRELLLQVCRRLNYPHGVISPGFTEQPDRLIQVATVQTLVRRLSRWAFDLIVCDETHHILCDTFMEIVNANPRARVLGVTATPVRLDGRGLGQVFDTLITGPSVAELIQTGYLAQPVVYAPSIPDITALHTRGGDYITSELERLADTSSVTGCAVSHYRKLAQGAPAIAFCVSVSHAERIAEQFQQAGYRAKCVEGRTPQRERDKAISDLGAGRLDVLSSCDLISEGVDVPVVGCGILLRPTKSTGLALQQMGRILRPAPHKEHALILDHAGNCLRHGLPDEAREWSLESGIVRRATTDDEDIEKVKQCQKCYYVYAVPPYVCPGCGQKAEPKPRVVSVADGELKRIEKAEAWKKLRGEIQKARTPDELRAIQKRQGYKPGWVHFVMQSRSRRATGNATG